MIIKGNPAGSVKFWSKHLLRDDTNSRAEVAEITGLLSEDLPAALKEMKAVADQSRCHGNFLYQANINPRDEEHLTAEQWKEAVDTLEKNLGLEGHQRIVIEHEKDGRVHRHVVWNRVDIETLRVADMGGNYYTHERTARELEARFGLEPTPSIHGQHREEGRPERTPELWEQRAASRSHIDPQELKAELTELWRSTDSGKAFASAIEERGYVLAKGDRRDFCVVDHAGDAHSLARRIEGARAKEVRERMTDIDRESLPTVAESRDRQHDRYPNQASAAEAWDKHLADREHDTEKEMVKAAGEELVSDSRPNKRDEVIPEANERWLEKVEAERARIDEIDSPDITRPALQVASSIADGVVSLMDWIGNFFDGGGAKPPQSPEAASKVERFVEMRRAEAALENIRDSIQRGENLQPSDLSHLAPTHLENIKAKGDDYLRELIEGIQRDQERKDDYGRSRER